RPAPRQRVQRQRAERAAGDGGRGAGGDARRVRDRADDDDRTRGGRGAARGAGALGDAPAGERRGAAPRRLRDPDERRRGARGGDRLSEDGAVVVRSAGILLHRGAGERREVWIAHMGGPFWARTHERAWSIPKGEYDPEVEEPLAAARREFAEELGVPAPDAEYRDLGAFRYRSCKLLRVFAADAPGF